MDIRPWMILLCVIEGHAVFLHSMYEKNSVFDNVVPQKGQLWTVSSRSQVGCCIICQKDSQCISYFYKDAQCTGFPFRMTSYVTTNTVPGLIYFDLDVLDELFVALLRGRWRDKVWLLGSSHNDRRNTLIVELAEHSALNVNELKGMVNYSEFRSLSGMAAIYICLRDNNVEPEATLVAWTDMEQRQRLMAFLGGSATLNQLTDHDLASMCF